MTNPTSGMKRTARRCATAFIAVGLLVMSAGCEVDASLEPPDEVISCDHEPPPELPAAADDSLVFEQLQYAIDAARANVDKVAGLEHKIVALAPAMEALHNYARLPTKAHEDAGRLWRECEQQWNDLALALETPAYISNTPLRDLLAEKERLAGGLWSRTEGIRHEWAGTELVIEGVGAYDKEGKERMSRGISSIDGWSEKWTDLVLDLEFTIVSGEFDLMLRYRPDGIQPFTATFKAGEGGFNADERYRMTFKIRGTSVEFEQPDQPPNSDTFRPTVSLHGGIGFAVPKGSKIVISRCAVRVLRKQSRVIGFSPRHDLAPRDQAIVAGLGWLGRHQSADGSWNPATMAAACGSSPGPVCTGSGSVAHVAGLTGLALLTHLRAGHDDQGPDAEVVINGLHWLRENQDAEGCFGSRSDQRFTYDHAIATLAICEAYAASRHGTLKASAQRGLEFILSSQNPYKGWRYGVRPGDNDSSVTGWMLMALQAGKHAGLTVTENSIQFGIDLQNSLTNPETGRTGYTKVGEHPVCAEGVLAKWPANTTEALTAIAMYTRISTNSEVRVPAFRRLGAELITKCPPQWDAASGKLDMYYWYFGTLALAQIGGADWDRWSSTFTTLALAHQIKDGCGKGSWDPKDPWAEDGGRIYSTCLMTLSLEVYYRYPRLLGADWK